MSAANHTPWHVVPADGTPFRFHVMRHNASIVEYLRCHWDRDSKGRSLFRSEADARAAIAKVNGSAQ